MYLTLCQTTKFHPYSNRKHFQTKKLNVAQDIKFVFPRVKLLLKRDKMLVTSIFSFPNNVFERFFPVEGSISYRCVMKDEIFSRYTQYILGSKKKVCTLFSVIFHCPCTWYQNQDQNMYIIIVTLHSKFRCH